MYMYVHVVSILAPHCMALIEIFLGREFHDGVSVM